MDSWVSSELWRVTNRQQLTTFNLSSNLCLVGVQTSYFKHQASSPQRRIARDRGLSVRRVCNLTLRIWCRCGLLRQQRASTSLAPTCWDVGPVLSWVRRKTRQHDDETPQSPTNMETRACECVSRVEVGRVPGDCPVPAGYCSTRH